MLALLESWASYMTSSKYEKEKARSRKVDLENEEAVQEKKRQVTLKIKVHKLRHKVRQMAALDRKMYYCGSGLAAMKEEQRQMYFKWKSGEMERELDALTNEHGYGKLRSQ